MSEASEQGLPYERLNNARITREFALSLHDKLLEVNDRRLDDEETIEATYMEVAQWYDRERDGIEHIIGRTALRLSGPGIGMPLLNIKTDAADDTSDHAYFHVELPKQTPWGERHEMMPIEGILSGFHQVYERDEETDKRRAQLFMGFRSNEAIRYTMVAGNIPVVSLMGYPQLMVKPSEELEITSPILEAYGAREAALHEIELLDGGEEFLYQLNALDNEYAEEQELALVDLEEPTIITRLAQISEALHDGGAEAYLIETALLHGLNEDRFFDAFGLEYDIEMQTLKDQALSAAGNLLSVVMMDIDETVPTPVMILENRFDKTIFHVPMKYITRLRF